ncbi:hypothetical protein WA026_006270 [Henosepilachna vigintioctopunctata]
MEPKELIIYDDKVEYTAKEIHNLINMIFAGNRHTSTSKGTSKVISAFGIAGFIRFLEGFYIILITKRRKVAVVGMHTLYKIEDTNMIYIPHESVRVIHPEEPRYVKMFQSIDLPSNFYFSYSYDLTHSLQHNLAAPKQFIPNSSSKPDEGSQEDHNNKFDIKSNLEVQHFGIRTWPYRKFVWNSHLLHLVEGELHPDWLLYIIHGFIGQSNINVFGRSIYVTLIARRSCRYAGTRFLKRGSNFQGDVANEVETEQMVHDSGVSSLLDGHFTSFVQMRGSIPGHWKQDMGKMVAKPAITLDLQDPYAETAAMHFNELFKRYGAPIVVLNLVKQRERKFQERLLSNLLSNSIKYLNQFLLMENQIIYKTFDMARKNKGTANVMKHLADIAANAVMKTGIFHNQRRYYSQKQNTIVGCHRENEYISLQAGTIRTNCVDCLDRTNTAQFAIGKCVLGYQLCALGILDSPKLEFDTDCVRMLESLYEDHGDTLALQYGGSQLVHRIKTYRKTAPWTSQGNDIMQTLSRYYSNTFSDAEKQNSINLFLGIFVPEEHKPQIWEYSSDYYFHHKPTVYTNKSLSQWWDKEVATYLPFSYNDSTKSCFEIIQVHSRQVEMIDAYIDYHRPNELSVLSDVYAYKISNSLKDFMPTYTTDYSPFSIRIRPVRRREDVSTKGNTMKNPSVTGQSSTGSTGSSTSSSGEESFADDDSLYTVDSSMAASKESNAVTFKDLFPTMKEVYGTELVHPKEADLLSYKKYVLIDKKANGTASKNFTTVSFNLRACTFSEDTSIKTSPPKIKQESINIYKKYIVSGITGGFAPKKSDLDLYKNYSMYK